MPVAGVAPCFVRIADSGRTIGVVDIEGWLKVLRDRSRTIVRFGQRDLVENDVGVRDTAEHENGPCHQGLVAHF